jgi:hypothetical protein
LDRRSLGQLRGALPAARRRVGEALLGPLHAGRVQGRADPHRRTGGTDDRGQQGFDAALEVLLQGPAGLGQRRPARVRAPIAGHQQAPGGVDDRDAVGGQPLHGRAHQVDDGPDLVAGQPGARPESQHHRRRRGALVLFEQAGLGQGQVHAGPVDGAQLTDGPRQLAFQRAPEGQALGEIGEAQLGPVEELEADGAAARQSLAGQAQPQFVDLAGRDEHAPALADPVAHAVAVQDPPHRLQVVGGEVREQDLLVAAAQRAPGQEGGQEQAGTQGEAEAGPAWQRLPAGQRGPEGQGHGQGAGHRAHTWRRSSVWYASSARWRTASSSSKARAARWAVRATSAMSLVAPAA